MGMDRNVPGKPAVVLLSGGLDSMVTAAIAQQRGFQLYALTINYGQRHVIELDSARRIANHLGVERHVELPLDLSIFGGSALTADIDVPMGGLTEGIPVTYVPARNLVFLSLTLAWAETVGAEDIFIGVNALDYSGYPDCRPEFIASFTETARLGTKLGVEGAGLAGKGLTVHAPLQHMTKADIARESSRLGLDTGMSWSCYNPTENGRACGSCDSCRLRRKGFNDAAIEDRIDYANTAD
jgi:7-cyano-7-deazaguanine synthase